MKATTHGKKFFVTGGEHINSNDILEVLLRWKGVLPSKMGNMANKRTLYQQFAGDKGDDDLGDPA